jgi:predicted Fe-Mo cluster-binding NifX family protein
MKVCITAAGTSIDSAQDPRFGRCESFYIYDSEEESGTFVDNPFKGAVGGAGVRAAELVISEGVTELVSGHFGPNAWEVLEEAKVKCYSAKANTVTEALEAWKAGSLKVESAPGAAGTHKPGGGGQGQGQGQGQGRGRGRS